MAGRSFVHQYRERLFSPCSLGYRGHGPADKLTEDDTVVAKHNDFAAAFESSFTFCRHQTIVM